MQVMRRIASAGIHQRRAFALVIGLACLVGISFSNMDVSNAPSYVAPFAAAPPSSVPGEVVAASPLDEPVDAPGTQRTVIATTHHGADVHASKVTALAARRLTVTGKLDGALAPGRSIPINIRIANRSSSTQRLSNVVVRITKVRAPDADAAHPCGLRDFAVTQFSGSRSVSFKRGSSRSFRQAGIARREWPRVRMLNRSTNQDGCKRASLTMSYRATTLGGLA